jgi:hypothetical protein
MFEGGIEVEIFVSHDGLVTTGVFDPTIISELERRLGHR